MPRLWNKGLRRHFNRVWRLRLLAVLSVLVAAAIHFAVAPEHFREYVPFGAFFVTVGTAQLALAASIVLRPSRWLWFAGGLGSLAIAVIWLFSRLVEVPIGPAAGRPEAIGGLDAVCTAMELLTVGALVVLALIEERS